MFRRPTIVFAHIIMVIGLLAGFAVFPTVAQDTVASTGMADGKLARFKVTADSHGSIGIDQISYIVSYTTATITNLRLYAFSDAAYSIPVSGVYGPTSDGQVGAAHAVVTTGVATSTATKAP